MASVYEFSDSDSDSEFTGFHPSDIESEIDSTSHMGSDISDVDLDSDICDNDNEIELEDPETNPPDWKPMDFQDFFVPPYLGEPAGPNLPPHFDANVAKPVDYFTLFFMEDLLSDIVTHSNAYAKWSIRQKKLLNPDYVDKQWSDDGSNDINLAELKAYFGILIILGINPVRQYKNAFSKDPYLGNEGIRKVMTLKWFEKMSQFMHVSNRELEIRNKNDPGYDPLYKVWPVIKAMDELFPKYCHMSPNCAIDESIIKCKPRLPYIIYCPFKPQR